MRTEKKRWLLRWSSGILTVVMILMTLPSVTMGNTAPSPEELYARSAVLMDADSGRVLYGKNPAEPMAMASTTKIMTCILALELSSPDQICTVSDYASSMPSVKMGARAGEQYYMKDLLYSLMLESHNDTAVVIAEAVSGSVDSFAEEMNQKAESLGCKDTYYITPNGLDGADDKGIHHTTAEDLARVMRYCIQNEDFCRITGTDSWEFYDCSGSRRVSCYNHNAFLDQMEGAFSGKTGFTGDAGYCYVGALRRDGKTLIVALLACGWPDHRNYKWKDTAKLMQYGLDAFESKTYDSGNLILEQMKVTEGQEAYVSVKMTQETVTLLMEKDKEISWELRQLRTIKAPVIPGMVVGYALLRLDGEILSICPIETDGYVEAAGWLWRIQERWFTTRANCDTIETIIRFLRKDSGKVQYEGVKI